MLESSRHLLQDARRAIGSKWEDKLFAPLREQYGHKAIDYVPEAAFKALNAEPVFVSDLSARPRLLKESGVVFANHPNGTLDTGIILSALQDEQGHVRKDFKMLVHPSIYEIWGKNLGQEHVLPAIRDYVKTPRMFTEIAQYVNDGGLFLIFPENTQSMAAGQPISFEDGLSFLLERVASDKMVYSFYINPIDLHFRELRGFRNSLIKGSMGLEAFLPKGLQLPRLGPKSKIRVGEHYSQNSEWLDAMKIGGIDRKVKSGLLRDHFLDLYKDNLNFK